MNKVIMCWFSFLSGVSSAMFFQSSDLWDAFFTLFFAALVYTYANKEDKDAM